MSESQAECLNGVLLAACMGLFSRYVEGSRAAAEDADGAKLQPVALSCVLNIGACKLKMSDWQGAVDSCLEVSLLMFFHLNILDLSSSSQITHLVYNMLSLIFP